MHHIQSLAKTAPKAAPVPEGTSAVGIKKADEELQIVWGEVYVPDFPDSQGDFMSAENIMKMAYDFMERQSMHKIDTNHDQEPNGSFVVESFIARKDDPDFIEGSWVIGVKIPDPEVWSLVKTGELNGFSFDGIGLREKKTIVLELPELLKGETDNEAGHNHTFSVEFGSDGEFLGGYTSPDPTDGHSHRISKGTITEEANGHTHRFSFLEGVLLHAPD